MIFQAGCYSCQRKFGQAHDKPLGVCPWDETKLQWTNDSILQAQCYPSVELYGISVSESIETIKRKVYLVNGTRRIIGPDIGK
jgi:hypothetical protein